MINHTKTYGKTKIHQEENDGTRTIMLKYYKTIRGKFNKNVKHYGVGVIKTEIGSNQINEEKQEFNNICKQKSEVEELLSVLLKNKVTTIDLKYVLEDMAL